MKPIGTCFSLDLAVKAVKEIFGDQLEAKKVNAEQLIDDLFHSAQRDFTVSPSRITLYVLGRLTRHFRHPVSLNERFLHVN